MATSPSHRQPAALEAWPPSGGLRPLIKPLLWSLLFHGVVAGVYFGFLAGRPSPVPDWLQELRPAARQPPQLTMSLIIVAGDGAAEPAPPAPAEPSPAPVNPTAPASGDAAAPLPAPENRPSLPPTGESPVATPTPETSPPSPTPPIPESPVAREPLIQPVYLPHAATAPAGPADLDQSEAKIGSGSGVENRSWAPSLTPAGGGASGSESPASAGNFAGARLRQPPNLQRFYPEAARRQALTGVTHLTLQVDARGRVQSARVTSSQPAGVFDQAALRAAGVLRFEPARCNGQPMPADFQLTIHWQLDK